MILALRFEVISKSEEVISSVPAAHKKNFVFQVISKSEEVISSVPAAHIDRLPRFARNDRRNNAYITDKKKMV